MLTHIVNIVSVEYCCIDTPFYKMSIMNITH